MDYNDLINEFLDGSLDSIQEDKFILLLTTSDEFRNEFRKSIALDKSLKADAMAIAPSAKATVNVFSGLGFAPPASTIPANAVRTGIAASMAAFLRQNTQGILSGVITALATALMFLLFYKPVGENSLTAQALNSAEYAPVHEFSMAAPVISSEEDLPLKERHAVTTGRMNRSIGNNNNDKNSVIVSSMDQDNSILSNPKPLLTTEKLVMNDPKIMKLGGLPININSLSLNLPKQESYSPVENNKLGFSIQFIGSQYWGLTGSDIQGSYNPRFSNTGIAVIVPVSDRIELLAELRQEFFFQKFTGVDDKGYRVNWSQFPNFLTYGGGIKYLFLKFDKLESYLQFIAAGNEAGQIGRAGLGLQWAPGSSYKFILGLEGSAFRYYHEGNPFNSFKLGINYGILFDL